MVKAKFRQKTCCKRTLYKKNNFAKLFHESLVDRICSGYNYKPLMQILYPNSLFCNLHPEDNKIITKTTKSICVSRKNFNEIFMKIFGSAKIVRNRLPVKFVHKKSDRIREDARKVLFFVARSLRGGGLNGCATKEKKIFFNERKKVPLSRGGGAKDLHGRVSK